MSSPITVRIQELDDGPHRIEVANAPHGYNIYVGPLVNNAAVEHGALINLLGVDSNGSIADQGWRLVDPNLPPQATRNGLHILWIGHDHSGPFSNGDLQVGVNSAFPGRHYANPIHTNDKSLGPVVYDWITVYSDDTLVLLFKPCERKASSSSSVREGSTQPASP